MPGYLLHVGATLQCPHQAPVSIASSQTVKVGGQLTVTANDTFTIAGCPFTIPPSKPQPCTTVQWLTGAQQVTLNGQPVLLQDSQGLCLSADQIPAGPPVVQSTQQQAKGT